MSQQGPVRHLATPRTLLFLERDGMWLFLEGASHKWFAGRLNGLGGSVEAGEDVLSAARREAREETGLEAEQLRLAAVVHVVVEPAVLLFVFRGRLPAGELEPTAEGSHAWHPPTAVADPSLPFLDDVRELVPRLRRGAADGPRSFTLRPPADLREP